MVASKGPGKWWAEFKGGNAAVGTKWGDIVLKRGFNTLPPTMITTLRAGETFSLEVPQTQTNPTSLTAVNAALSGRVPLDLAVGSDSSAGVITRCSKIESLAIKQKVSEGRPVIEIQLRKL